MTVTENARTIASYVSGTPQRQIPENVLDAARMCLADWCAVGLGAFDQPAGVSAMSVAKAWSSTGRAPMFFSGYHAPTAAAFVNGTFAHCLDFDDTHFGCLAHLSGPTWAATLATASHRGLDDETALRAFINGFEVASRLGGNGLGHEITGRGIHSTAVFGRLSAAVAASYAYGLNEQQIMYALGAAATQCIGLVASFGTMSKPLHAGKAALDGVLSAELASAGFESKLDLLEAEGQTLAASLVQDGLKTFPKLSFGDEWQILQDTFKPFAACNLTHATIETGQKLASEINLDNIDKVIVNVHPSVLRLAGKPSPNTPLEGKFSNQYCAALGLSGYDATKRDFDMDRITDPKIRGLMEKVTLTGTDGVSEVSATMTVHFGDGSQVSAETPISIGNPGNPLGWEGMERKFNALVEPVLGDGTETLFKLIRNTGDGNTLPQIAEILSGDLSLH